MPASSFRAATYHEGLRSSYFVPNFAGGLDRIWPKSFPSSTLAVLQNQRSDEVKSIRKQHMYNPMTTPGLDHFYDGIIVRETLHARSSLEGSLARKRTRSITRRIESSRNTQQPNMKDA